MLTRFNIDAIPAEIALFSRRIRRMVKDRWSAKNLGVEGIERDLMDTSFTNEDLDWVTVAFAGPEQHSDDEQIEPAVLLLGNRYAPLALSSSGFQQEDHIFSSRKRSFS